MDEDILDAVGARMLEIGTPPQIVERRLNFLSKFDNPTHYSRYKELSAKHSRYVAKLNPQEQLDQPSFMSRRMEAVQFLRGKEIGATEILEAEKAVGIPEKFEKGSNLYSQLLKYPGGGQ